MLNEFTAAYYDDQKIKNAFGEYNGTQLLKNAKRIFGGKEQVFFEYGRDELSPIFNNTIDPKIKDVSENVILKVNQHIESPSGLTAISMTGGDIDAGTSRYDVEYANQHCRPILLGNFKTYETKKYYSIDLSYILAISRSFTDLNFENFEGEGLRILKAWLFVMSYGFHHPDEHELIMVRSSKNEYGNDARNRVIVRNSYYKKGEAFNKMGAPYGESRDGEWTLSADDYAKVAALDSIFTQLSLGTPLLYNGSIVPDLIRNSRQYGATVPDYFNSIMDSGSALRTNNTEGY